MHASERVFRVAFTGDFYQPDGAPLYREFGLGILDAQPGIRYHLATAWLKLGEAEAARREVRAALQSGRPFDQEPEARQLLRELGDTTR